VSAPAAEFGQAAPIPVIDEFSPELPLVNVSLSLRAGSELDPPGKEGVSEILMRLMRRNAGGRDADDNDRIVDRLGASVGADVAPSTMGFHGTVISRSYQEFVDLLSETFAAPRFQADEFNRLKREIHGELIESLDNDRSLARRWFRRTLFAGHPYGRPVSGTPASLERIELADVLDLYERALVQENLICAFAGDVSQERANRSAQAIAARLRSGEPPKTSVATPEAPQGRRLVIVDKPDRSQTQILIGCLGTHPQDDDHTALHVANTIFGGTFTARLTQEVRAKRGWSYGAYSSLPFDRCRHAFSMWTFPKAGDAAQCLKLELDLLEQWVNGGVTKKELAWAKRYLVRSHAFALDTAAKRVSLKLDAELYHLPAGYYEDYEARVQAVTLDQANEAIKKRISAENLLCIVVGTASEIRSPVEAVIDRLAGSETVAFDNLT
jgi:zinc protease